MRFLFLALTLLACDNEKRETSEKSEKSEKSAKSAKKAEADDAVSVKDYCAKMIKLDAKAAKANGVEAPELEQVLPFCKMMFDRAKSKEPEAYACMAACMMDSDLREDEQACTTKKKCLAKAENPKLFSNRKD